MSNIRSLSNRKMRGIVAVNSIDYVKHAFASLDADTTVIPLREKEDQTRIAATGVTDIVSPESKHGWFTPTLKKNTSEEIAQISFTSGTEGVPKGVAISYRALNDVVERLSLASNIDSSAREYIGVPVYHSFGYGRCRLLAHVGGQGYLPENGFNPVEIADMLQNGEVNALSAVPSLLRIVLINGSLFENVGKDLKWIEIGSQPMSMDEKEALCELFPNACIIQHYGLTEASRTTLLRIDDRIALDSVGQCFGETSVTIIENKIATKGPHLASGLLIDGKLQPLVNESGWFVTSDLGEINDGYLFFLGRADNMINCGGQKISAELIESSLIKEFNLGGGIAVTKIADPSYGDGILVASESEIAITQRELVDCAKGILSENGLNATNALKFLELDALPTTDTGKVQRNKIAELYRDNLAKNSQHIAGCQPGDETFLGRIQEFLGPNICPSSKDSIESLGLDSITVVGVSIAIDHHLGYIPNDFRKLDFGTLEHLDKQTTKSARASSDDRMGAKVKGSTNENPGDIGFWALVKEDFHTHERDFFSQGFWAIFNHRFGNWRMGVRLKLLRAPLTIVYRIHLKLIQVLCGIKLDYTVRVGRRVKLEHFGGIIVGAVEIGDDVTLRQNTTLGIKDISNLSGKPILEQGVNVGTGAVIVGEVRVGRYSVIGPNSVVDTDIPPFSIVNAAPSVVTSQNFRKDM